MTVSVTTRFAPSPTGHLHLGHAYAALIALRTARSHGGVMALRIEDIDRGRCRPEYEAAILEDLDWLGIEWQAPLYRQSEREGTHRAALARLADTGDIYPCFCTRADIRREIERAGSAPHDPDGPIYLGTCRNLEKAERKKRLSKGTLHAWRLDVHRVLTRTGALYWEDLRLGRGATIPGTVDDAVLARRDGSPAYHLAATLDDHDQGVRIVTRGEDLFSSTAIHRILQELLGLDVPRYLHHDLVRDAQGRRLAKHDQALAISALRKRGTEPNEVLRMSEEGMQTDCPAGQKDMSALS